MMTDSRVDLTSEEIEPPPTLDEPALFDINMRFVAVTDRPDELEAIFDGVIAEAERRGLFYQSGHSQIMEDGDFVPREGSPVYQALTGKGGEDES
jgi:hypothetical protein